MKPSATLDRVDVKEMGLRSLLMSSIVEALESGRTSAIFQAQGILCSEKEVLRRRHFNINFFPVTHKSCNIYISSSFINSIAVLGWSLLNAAGKVGKGLVPPLISHLHV